jgi:DNA-binding LacI/PurR family transcriptional regulator
VAQELGVSAKTVSNAYSRPDQLSARLREEVFQVAARIGYAGPDPVAAGLRRGRVGAVGFVFANRLSYAFDDPTAVDMLRGVTQVIEDRDLGLLLIPRPSAPGEAAQAVLNAPVDALVLASLADDDPAVVAALDRRLPVAVIDQPRPATLAALASRGVPWVGIDDRAAADEAMTHLLDLGHARVAVVPFALRPRPRPGPVDARTIDGATYAVTRDRLAGCRSAVERAGLPWADVPVYQGATSSVDDGRTAGRMLLGLRPRPTAVLCLSDRLAVGLLEAAATAGVAVPEALSVVGFDGSVEALGRDLATVRQDNAGKGAHAARQVVAGMADGTGATVDLLGHEYRPGSTTAPPADGHGRGG